MCKRKTTEEFIEDAIKVHGDKYDYSLVEYKTCKSKILIKCSKGHEFLQSSNNHLRGKGCRKCYDINRTKEKTVKIIENKTKNFIEKAILKHGDNFDYSLVEYINAKTKVTIICKKEGHVFEQAPTNHVSGFGCMACGRKSCSDQKRKDTKWFIEKAKLKHGNTYSYDKANYIESNKTVEIKCKSHGYFKQTVNAHLAGKGCRKCALINSSFSRSGYIDMAKGREGILYLIRCWNEEEEFYKIGKTYQKVKERYKKGSIPYNYEIISEYTSDVGSIFDLEIELHKKYAKYSYEPLQLFGGFTECYNLSLPTEELKALHQ